MLEKQDPLAPIEAPERRRRRVSLVRIDRAAPALRLAVTWDELR